jgi:hypothetical protein
MLTSRCEWRLLFVFLLGWDGSGPGHMDEVEVKNVFHRRGGILSRSLGQGRLKLFVWPGGFNFARFKVCLVPRTRVESIFAKGGR